MKKLIISSILLASFGLANAQPHHPYPERHQDRHEQRENRMDIRGLERDAMQQKSRIDRAVYSRQITPEQASWVKDGYNKVWYSIDRAKRDRRISDREVRKIEENLHRNERDLERAIRESNRGHRRG